MGKRSGSLVVVALFALALPGAPAGAGEGVPEGWVTWLRGDAGTITQEAGAVQAWASREPGVDAVAVSAGQRPVFEPAAMNGLGAVHFDGVDDMLELAFDVNVAATPTVTVFTTFRSDTAEPDPLRKLWGNDDGGFDRTVGIDDRAPQQCNYGFFAGPGGGFADYFGLEADTTYVTTDVYTPTEFRGRVNGADVVAGEVDNGTGLPTTFLGGSGTAFDEFWMGHIAEFIVFDRALSAAEVRAVESYLIGRYEATAQPVPCGVEPPTPEPFEPGVSRIDGGDSGRLEDIAIDACTVLLPTPDAARAVILARNDVFADALAGAPLAGDDSCILFTAGGPDAPLDPATRAEIDRVLADGGPVRVLGGANAVSAAVQAELEGAGYAFERFAGATRFETAIAIATAVRAERDGPSEAIVAYAQNWPDAVTAGAYGAATGVPIVLTETASLHPATAAFLEGDGTAATFVVGGSGVISDAVLADLPNPTRVAGPNRMATAVATAEGLWSRVPEADGQRFVVVNIEREDGWTIALAAAPLSAREAAPQLGVGTDRYPDETQAYFTAQGFEELPAVVLIGNAAFISEGVADEIEVTVTG